MKGRVSTRTAKTACDEHVQILIDNQISACQAIQAPVIMKAQQTAERVHARLDEYQKSNDNRLVALDHEEVGKVTILWKERNKIIGVGAILLLFILLNLFVGIINGGRLDRQALKDAVKAAIQESKP